MSLKPALNVICWQAAELDLEQEAAALSFLGLIHQKILFSTTRSKQYYKRCLELVDAARPKTFLTQEWYKQCVEGFMKIQEKERMRDEAAQQKIKDKVRLWQGPYFIELLLKAQKEAKHNRITLTRTRFPAKLPCLCTHCGGAPAHLCYSRQLLRAQFHKKNNIKVLYSALIPNKVLKAMSIYKLS